MMALSGQLLEGHLELAYRGPVLDQRNTVYSKRQLLRHLQVVFLILNNLSLKFNTFNTMSFVLFECACGNAHDTWRRTQVYLHRCACTPLHCAREHCLSFKTTNVSEKTGPVGKNYKFSSLMWKRLKMKTSWTSNGCSSTTCQGWVLGNLTLLSPSSSFIQKVAFNYISVNLK